MREKQTKCNIESLETYSLQTLILHFVRMYVDKKKLKNRILFSLYVHVTFL